MFDLPSQYVEEVETFRHILDLPDPRETMPKSSATVLGLDNEKGQQELKPRGPSAMLSLSPYLKNSFEKFEQDFLASNLPEGKYIKPPASTAKWYKVGQPCFEDKRQELNSYFAKICISPKPSGAPMGKVPLQVLKELEHQARLNLFTINFGATFVKTASTCNTTMEKCQDSLKSTFERVKRQIQKGANPEKGARRGYENACDYFEMLNTRILIQLRALACLSKSLAHILQRELYTMGNTGLLRHESEMTLLQCRGFLMSRTQEFAILAYSFVQVTIIQGWRRVPPLKGTPKDSQGFGPYQNKPFRGPQTPHHNKKRGSYRKCPYGGNSPQSSNRSFSSGRVGNLNNRGFRSCFRPHSRGRGHGNPSPQ